MIILRYKFEGRPQSLTPLIFGGQQQDAIGDTLGTRQGDRASRTQQRGKVDKLFRCHSFESQGKFAKAG
jgi:hypothetical protein